MSRQVNILAIIALALVLGSTGFAQSAAYFVPTYTQLGMMSGSGLVFTPSTISSPAAQFRLQLGRISLGQDASRGVNVVALSAGLSSFLEGYLKYTGEQVGSVQSNGTIGIGAKFTIPYVFPVIRMISLWGESSTNPSDDHSFLYPSNISRGAVIITPAWNGYRPSLLVGATRRSDGTIEAMEGGSFVVTTSRSLQWGIEYLHGYNGTSTHHAMFSCVVRPFPYASINAGPGYVSSPLVSGWLWSVGISVNSSDINFKPVQERATNQYKLPTIEEMEKGTNEPNGESTKDNLDD
jgi:hypothetical protein